ncbi:MAG: AsnC family protein [Thiothrix sp.]|nr:MAG: AsnC family protein [Thiothrix sp.]
MCELPCKNLQFERMTMNSMNKAILQRLRANARMSWQQIGKEVHLTGQAVERGCNKWRIKVSSMAIPSANNISSAISLPCSWM